MPAPNFSPDTIVQETYDYSRGRALPGERPRANIYHDLPRENCVYAATDASQITEITFTATNAGDDVAVMIDGVSIPFDAAASTTLTAAAGATALTTASGPGKLLEPVIDEATANLAVLTIVFEDFGPHDVSFVGTVGTTATVANTTEGTASVRAVAGTVACLDETQGDPSVVRVVQPSAAGPNVPVGVVARGPYTTNQTPPGAFGLVAPQAYPGRVCFSAWEDAEVEVRLAGDVSPFLPVYFVTSPGPTNGFFTGTSGATAGTGQVSELTITPAAGQDVSIHYDDLPPTTVFISVDLATDNVNLANAINSNAAYAAILASPAVVDAGKVILNFIPDAVHVFTDDSEAAAAVAEVITTPAVAATPATAALYPGAKWLETRTAAQGTAIVHLG